MFVFCREAIKLECGLIVTLELQFDKSDLHSRQVAPQTWRMYMHMLLHVFLQMAGGSHGNSCDVCECIRINYYFPEKAMTACPR